MAIEINDLYQSVLAYWPEKIDVKEKKFFATGGVRIPDLIIARDSVDRKIHSMPGDEVCMLRMSWALFTVLHGMAKSTDVLNLSDVKFDEVKEAYTRDLDC